MNELDELIMKIIICMEILNVNRLWRNLKFEDRSVDWLLNLPKLKNVDKFWSAHSLYVFILVWV